MAPEIYWGRKYGHTADVYSLAIVLYRYLNNNRTPFLPMGNLLAGDREKAKECRMSGEAVLAPVNGSEQLKQVVLKALNYNPEKRYQSAAEFRKALESCYRNTDIPTSSDPSPQLGDDVGTMRVRPSVDIPLPNLHSDANPPVNDNLGTMRSKPPADAPMPPRGKNKPILFMVLGIGIVLVIVVAIVMGSKNKPFPSTALKPASTETTSESADCNIIADATRITVGETTTVAFETGEYIYRGDDLLIWTSSDASVAVVDGNGIVTGMSVGTVTITGKLEDHEAVINITVEENVIQDDTEDNNSDASVTLSDMVDSLEVYCYTTTLLIGDSINTRLKADDWIIDGSSAPIKWSTDNTVIASIDDQGVLTAHSIGICNLIANYGGKTASQEIKVVDVDKNSCATVIADFEKISLSSNSEDTVNLTFGGDMPERFGATSYYSAGVTFELEWGELNDNSVSLTIQDIHSADKEGYVTILVYDQEDSNKIIASTKIYVRIN